LLSPNCLIKFFFAKVFVQDDKVIEFTNIERDELPSLQIYVKGYLEIRAKAAAMALETAYSNTDAVATVDDDSDDESDEDFDPNEEESDDADAFGSSSEEEDDDDNDSKKKDNISDADEENEMPMCDDDHNKENCRPSTSKHDRQDEYNETILDSYSMKRSRMF
jgi:hypothetical protein